MLLQSNGNDINNSGSQINFSGKNKSLAKQGAGNYEQKS